MTRNHFNLNANVLTLGDLHGKTKQKNVDKSNAVKNICLNCDKAKCTGNCKLAKA